MRYMAARSPPDQVRAFAGWPGTHACFVLHKADAAPEVLQLKILATRLPVDDAVRAAVVPCNTCALAGVHRKHRRGNALSTRRLLRGWLLLQGTCWWCGAGTANCLAWSGCRLRASERWELAILPTGCLQRVHDLHGEKQASNIEEYWIRF